MENAIARKLDPPEINPIEIESVLLNLLDRCRLNGYTPEEIINRSIANGWQGLFEPDGQAKRSRDTDQESIHWNSPDAWRDFL